MADQNFKNIIVGLDLSDYSKVVARQALALSEKLSIPCQYVYVLEFDAYYASMSEKDRKYCIEQSEKDMRQKYRLKISDAVTIRLGSAFEQLIKTAKDFEAPLILVGHKGQNPLTRLILGSTAEKLALLSPFPLWIHRGNKTVLPHNILIPCDLSDRADQTLSKLKTLRPSFNPNVELLYVQQEPAPILDYNMYALMYLEIKKANSLRIKKFKKKHPALKCVPSYGGVVGQIQTRAKKFDVIALTPRNHYGKTPYFGSITAKLIRSGNQPAIILP